MRPRLRQLPPTLYLGPGRLVNIHRVPEAVLKEVCHEDPLVSEGAWCYNYDAKQWDMYILDTLSLTRQWEVFRHELRHALVDLDP